MIRHFCWVCERVLTVAESADVNAHGCGLQCTIDEEGDA